MGALGYADDAPLIDPLLRTHGTAVRTVVVDMLTSVDVPTVHAAGGLTVEQVGRLRRRLVHE